jgi:hypothetical protein
MHMRKSILSVLLAAVVATTLVACGGEDERCGAETQQFGITFANAIYSAKVGQAATVSSNITPESCRSKMTFAVRTGALPPGMQVVDGNVSGTPTALGNYQFQISISAIGGYAAVSSTSPPRSGTVLITVSP